MSMSTKSPIPGVAVACVIVSASLVAAQPSADTVTLFEGARLIPGDGTDPIESSAFLVEADELTRVGRRGEVTAPEGAARVDLTGKTVIPMMITVHSHPGVLKGVVMSEENYSRESVIDSLKRFAYYGFAAVGSMGVEPGDVPYLVRAEPEPGAALLRTAGRGFGWPQQSTGFAAVNDIPYGVTSPEEARARMRELAEKKPDFVKIWVDDRGGRHVKLTPPIYRPIIEEAHEHGIPVVAHIYYLSDAKDLADAGVQGFVHLTRDQEVDDALVRKMKANNMFITPNIFMSSRSVYKETRPAWLGDPELLATVPEDVVREIAMRLFSRNGELLPMAEADAPNPRPDPSSTYAHMQRSVKKLNEAGVDIVLGADTGPPGTIYGFNELLALEALVDSGMTPMEVIVAATSRAARIMKLYDLGSMVEGKTASFVVLDASPLENIRNVRRIADVYQNGARLDRAAMSAAWVGN